VSARTATAVRLALALAGALVAGLASGGVTAALAQAPTLARADYPQLGGRFVAADFNGDGRLDLAGSAATAAAVLLNNGSGGFAARAEFPVAGNMQDLAPGDFNATGTSISRSRSTTSRSACRCWQATATGLSTRP
jgi:hypothetical protein